MRLYIIRYYGRMIICTPWLSVLVTFIKGHAFFFLFFSQGEMYKLFWSDQPEFVRMAARFGATIVPFGVVGEDDLAEVSTHFSSFLSLIILID